MGTVEQDLAIYEAEMEAEVRRENEIDALMQELMDDGSIYDPSDIDNVIEALKKLSIQQQRELTTLLRGKPSECAEEFYCNVYDCSVDYCEAKAREKAEYEVDNPSYPDYTPEPHDPFLEDWHPRGW